MTRALKLLLLTFLPFTLYAQSGKNINFRSNVTFNGSRLSNIWGYVDTTGREYALVGVAGVDTSGFHVSDIAMAVVDVTDPENPQVKFTVDGPNSIWREIRTWGKYAYVTTEAEGGGVTIVDLSKLPNTISSKVFTDNLKISRVHALHIDQGKLYLYGGNYDNALPNKGVIMLSLADPWNPQVTGTYSENYVHDGFVRNDTIYACEIYTGQVSVIDVTDPANPQVLTSQTTPGAFPHNSWMSTDLKTLYTTDEVTSSFVAAYDISDLNDIKELDRYQSQPGSQAIAHNTYVMNNPSATGFNTDLVVTSYYKNGVTVVDASRPDNLVEVGYYDTSPLSGSGYHGAWGVYPYLPSGNLLVSDIDEGMFVLTPIYKRACFIEGNVKDKYSGSMLNGVKVKIETTPVSDFTNIDGDYKIGYMDAGAYQVRFSLSGYYDHIENITISNGAVLPLNVEMTSLSSGIQPASEIRIEAYPNPFSDRLQISYMVPEDTKEGASISVCNILGEEIYAYPLTLVSGRLTIEPNLPKGIYEVKIRNNNHVFRTIQVMKM